MPYDEFLADRMRSVLKAKAVAFEEKKMMGGLCFMVNEKMCAGIVKDQLMARIGPYEYENALKKEACREMDFTGKALKGYVFVQPEGLESDNELEYWIDLCLKFNSKARSSKRR